MKRHKLLLPALLVFVLLAGLFVWQHRPVRVDMRLNLTGTPGLKIAGTISVDGVPQAFGGTVPAHIDVTAKAFEYTIFMQAPTGEFRGELLVANGIYGSSTAANDFSGVKGAYSHNWTGKGGMMTTANRGD